MNRAGDYEPATNPLPKFPTVLAYNPDSQHWFWEAGKVSVSHFMNSASRAGP